MKPGKKKKLKLEARIKGYTKTIQGDSSKTVKFSKPGSNKKS